MTFKSVLKRIYRSTVRGSFYLPTRFGFNFYVIPDDTKSAACAFGVYEFDDTKVLASLPVNGAIVIDVGANIGFYSLLLASAYPDSEIHAFDPSKYNESRVRQNLSINKKLASRITFHQMGVSSQKGSLEFFAVPGPAGHAWGRLEEQPVAAANGIASESYQVDVDSLDSVFEGRTDDIGLIKIDVEGHELEVFKGMRKIIAAQKAIIMFEVSLSYLVLHPGQFQEMLQMFEGTSYEKFVTAGQALVPYTWPHERVFNLYMIPESKRQQMNLPAS